tara:strand:- start:131 stop:442 length:312 start_codon:yes stop_codon:yes gene_type:complete
MKKIKIVVIILLGLMMFAMSNQRKWQRSFTKNNKPYSSEITYNFVASCIEGGGAVEACSCIFDQIVANMTEAEYLKEETKYILQDSFSDEFLEIISEARLKCQ